MFLQQVTEVDEDGTWVPQGNVLIIILFTVRDEPYLVEYKDRSATAAGLWKWASRLIREGREKGEEDKGCLL